MPLLGKIVVIKRNGGDGTEFPLTASCLFGRKLDCDIRIQLPQVSKEHCKIELNENKELILTNLSSVNPTKINGEVLNQSERLKHGDLITIIDRSFRFEYPPPKTPKKKGLSTPGKDKAVQALQEQQEKGTPVSVDKRKSEHSFDTCLKDGSNLPPSVEQSIETESEDGKLKDSMSPFCELYQMVKQDLVAKTPRKSEPPKTPLTRPQVGHENVPSADVKSTPKRVTTPSTKKRRSSQSNSEDTIVPATPQRSLNANVEEKTTDDMPSVGSATPLLTEKSETPVSLKKRTPSKTPQKFSAGEVVNQILLEPQSEEKTPKSPKGRRSGGSQDLSLAQQMPSAQPQTPGSKDKNTEVKMSPRTSPRANAGKRFQAQDVLPEIAATTSASKKKAAKDDGNISHNEMAILKAKKKRVSFGGQLSPELFDKCLPPDSPLRRGATPRRSLGPSQKPQSLLRRASTIGLLALRLEEKSSPRKASPKRAASPAKTQSPAKRTSSVNAKTPSPAKKSPSTKAKTPSPAKKSPNAKAKTPSPAKRSPSTKVKTPSPKPQMSPSASTMTPTPSSKRAAPRTTASAKRASTSTIEAASDVSLTPRVQGRFSISRISTPSPVQDQEDKPEPQSNMVEDVKSCVTPKIPLRRKSMKSSARKTPRSAIKSALDVMRLRHSGASRANLKVLNSWADIVKFGQTKPQTEVTNKKKSTKSSIVKRTAVPKPKTPARRLKDIVSTGHAASPVTIVVGKAHMRTNQSVGAAPKIVPNIALFKKDMKMDEDLTGVAEIFKTPANTRSKNRVPVNNECPEIPLDEISVMKTPEESGEMVVSPLSVVSTAKRGRYNDEAVTRLLLENQDSSLLVDEGLSQLSDNQNEMSCNDIVPDVETPSDVQTEEEKVESETVVKTPKQKAAPSLCLTGVKRLMKTPKQKAEPIEDLRGKLLKTPRDCKPPQHESLEGVKEILKTPKYRGTPVEDMVGVKRVMQTPKEKAEQHEDLTGVKELMKTPEIKGDMVEKKLGLKRLVKTPKQKKNQVEEDLTGVQHLMKTPKHKGEPVEDHMGVKRLMQTPKEKVEPVEDFSGVKQLMQTPKQKGEPVNSQTPQLKEATDSTGLKDHEPENSFSLTTESMTEPTEVQEPVASGSAFMPAEGLDEECDKENVCPVETVETEVSPVDLQCTAEAVESIQSHPEIVSAEAIDVCSSEADDKIQEQSEETVCVCDNTTATVEATPTSSTAEQEELIKSPSANKIPHGTGGRAAQKSKNDKDVAKAPAVLSLIDEEKISSPLPASPTRGRRGKKLIEVPEITASPVRKSARGRIPKNSVVEEEAKNTRAPKVPVESMSVEVPDCLPVVTKTRKGRKAKQDDVDAAVVPTDDANAVEPLGPVANEEQFQAPVVKSSRRKKMDKTESQPSEEPKVVCEETAVAPENVDAAVVPTNDVNAVEPQCPVANEEQFQAPVVKSGRRKKMDKTESQPSEELEVVCEETAVAPENVDAAVVPTDAVEPQCPEANEEQVQGPVVKSGRRKKMDKTESQLSEEPEDACAEDVNLQTSLGTEMVSATRARRGRPAKKGNLKTEPTPALKSEITSTHAVVVAEKPLSPVAKSGRGRKGKKETVKDQPLDDVADVSKTVAEANADHKEEPETPVVKSGRGRKAKQQKPQMPEDVVEQPAVDTSAVDVPVMEENTETVVKSVRGSRKTKQSKVTDSVEADESAVSPVEKALTPVVKSGRKRAVIAKEPEVVPDVPVKRGRRAVAKPAPPVAVVSSRGRKAVAKAEPEVTEDVTASEEPVKPVKQTRRTAKAPESKKEDTMMQAGSENTPVVALEKVERGSRGKKQKDSTKDISIDESATAEKASETKSSKTVNWNPELVACKDIEESETSTDVKEPQAKKSKRLGKLPAEMTSTESNQPADLPPRGRRGRGAKKEVPPIEESQEVKPVRRGKAVAPSAPKSEPTDSKASTPLKRKRNEVVEVSDESVNKEPLPKRRGRVANSAEVEAEVSSKEKTPEVEPEKAEPTPKKTGNRAARGQKRTAQEPNPAPAKAQESVSGTTTRKGRSVKKVEEVDVPTEAAPVRRTRRK
ncbi:proliferation marker protein Ki-67 [Garra rufa]|uniref:proliferation marker protein Ki-67 n=1 Tax=Garra rufa TaxID=137080 RepID=UPI003CCE61A2